MSEPQFRTKTTERGQGVTYDCGCSCEPTAYKATPAGFEHCCCGKVHFVGSDAVDALTSYLDERARRRKREPTYERGATTVELVDGPTPVAWAFPV